MPDLLANLPPVTLRRSSAESFHDLERARYDEVTQTMPRDQLRAHQDEGLRDIITRTFERPVPFFQRKLESAGIAGADDITSVDDLDRIPITIKQELRDSEAESPPVGDYRGTDLRQNVRIGTSTGTTGTPTIMLWTRPDLLVEMEAAARVFWRQGIRPGMILTHAHPAYLYGGGLMLTNAYEHLGCLPVWVPPPDTDELGEVGIKMWQRVAPDKPFMGFATARFFEIAGKLGIDPKDAGLDFSKMPQLTRDGQMPLMTSGAECMAYLGSPCGELNGAHVCEDWALVQSVDPDTGQSLPDGQWGHLVVTTIGRDNFMLRYDLEEAVKLDRSPCPCGETSLRGWWGGRFKDLIATQGRSFMLFDIENPLKRVPEVGEPALEWVVVRPAEGAEDAPLLVRAEVSDGVTDTDRAERAATDALETALGVRVTVEVLERGALPRSGYKATRVVDA